MKGNIMVEYKYFKKVYKDVIKKNYLDSFVFLKIIGTIMVITLLSMFTTMEKMAMKDT